MRELVRTNNAVLITAIEALLKGAEIPHMVLDQHMSVLEGSLGMLPRRIVVDDEHRAARASTAGGCGPGARAAAAARAGAAAGDHRRRRARRPAAAEQKRGHRVGHDAILLAAATDARPGDRAVDFGAGVGAAALALAVRVSRGRRDAGRDRSGAVGASRRRTSCATDSHERVRAVTLDVTAPSDDFAAARLGPGRPIAC